MYNISVSSPHTLVPAPTREEKNLGGQVGRKQIVPCMPRLMVQPEGPVVWEGPMVPHTMRKGVFLRVLNQDRQGQPFLPAFWLEGSHQSLWALGRTPHRAFHCSPPHQPWTYFIVFPTHKPISQILNHTITWTGASLPNLGPLDQQRPQVGQPTSQLTSDR